MTSHSSSYRTAYNKLLGEESKVIQTIRTDKHALRILVKSKKDHEEANEIVKQVAQKTQQELQYHLSDLTSMAMEAVFPNDPYKLVVEFVQRRDKTECDIYFERDGNRANPSVGGGGAVDIGSFALRIASWTMQNPRSRNTLILDEPFSRLKGMDANKKAIQMVKQLSHKLNLQIIMVSDERVPMDEIEKGADKVFKVSLIKDGDYRVSKIEEKEL